MGELPEEVIVENERGFTVLGYPLYSSKMLFPRFDPPQFQLYNKATGKMVSVAMNRIKVATSIDNIFPLNLNEYAVEGHWNADGDDYKWFVMMDANGTWDSDEQGWFYSWNFNNRRWKCKNGIVRRRIWIRLSAAHQLCPNHTACPAR